MYLQSEIISTCPASCRWRTVLFTVSAFDQSHRIESEIPRTSKNLCWTQEKKGRNTRSHAHFLELQPQWNQIEMNKIVEMNSRVVIIIGVCVFDSFNMFYRLNVTLRFKCFVVFRTKIFHETNNPQ